MSRSRKLLVIAGLLLAVVGMIYGLWYAVFDEHQTLENMGGALANGFALATERNVIAASAALDQFSEINAEYVREVHAHSHWITLGLLLIALGMAFDRVRFAESVRFWLAVALVFGSALFPLGVLLQAFSVGVLAKAMSVLGSVAIIVSFAVITLGLLLPDKQAIKD